MSVSAAAMALALNLTPANAAAFNDPMPGAIQSGGAGQGVSAPVQPVAATPPPPDPPMQPLDGAPVIIINPPSNASQSGDAEIAGPEIIVTAPQEIPGDPLADINERSYEAIQAADAALVAPIALAYEDIAPKPLRDGLRNFLRNLEEPIIALNYLLQLKPGRALKSVARFTVNTTLGVAGLMDVAKKEPFNLPYTPNGFANTFACYGIGPGPYLFLPLVGPTTVRDLIGVTLDRFGLPAVIGPPLSEPYYSLPAATIDALNDRIEIDGQLKEMRANSDDPYTETRELYLKQRKAEIAAICPKKGEVIDENLPPRPGKGRD